MTPETANSPHPEDSLTAYRRIVLDVHTHHPVPQPEGIVALDPSRLPAEGAYPAQYYSVGIHPWEIHGIGATPQQLQALREAGTRGDVVAIGETGIDMVRPNTAPLVGQMNAFKAHVQLSEQLGKPLIIHSVKAQDMIIGVKKDMQPRQPWIIHGFRGKPTVMKMYTDQGIYLGFGARFNPESLLACPAELLLAETDEAPGRIQDIIAALNTVRTDVTPDLLAANMRRIFSEI
ncbi:MAG: TatD family hydrolase [Muribaculaceae bacterium]|nr:TatD family hydrolase [Muribaculaceae bacterium]